MKVWSGILIVFLVAGFVSCTSTRKITYDRALSLKEVLKRVQERNDKIKTIQGKGTITVESSEKSNSGSFSVDLKKPDSLRMELHGPFGIRVGTLMLSREQFLFYNWMENTAVVGKPDGKTLNSLFRLKMQFDQILNAFTGEIQKEDDRDTLDGFTVENNLYIIRYHFGKVKKEYRIDGDAFIVTDYRITDENGETVITAHASEIEDFEDIPSPKFLRIIFQKERRSVTVAYDDLLFNENVTCSFNVPKQAEIIDRR